MPPLYMLIKPASGQCNLRCRYCFYRDLTEKREVASYGIMEVSTLEQVIRKTLETAEGACTFAYQGGEPTLAGLSFFKESVRLQNLYNRRGITVHNALQTNGMLLNHEWAHFLAENRFLVGVSLDGTSRIHDEWRRDGTGEGTFTQVMQGIRCLRQAKAEFNILTVLHAGNARRIREIYRYFKAQSFRHLQFIPCLDPLGDTPGGEPYSLTPAAYGECLCTLFDLWYADLCAGEEVHIRHFENYVEMLLGYPPESCGMSGVCGMQYVVEADGAVYPCDFYVTDRYRLGNLCTDSFADLDRVRAENRFVTESTVSDPACRDCFCRALCRGGCKRYREPRIGDALQRNLYCESYRRFFAYAGDRLEYLARRIRRAR